MRQDQACQHIKENKLGKLDSRNQSAHGPAIKEAKKINFF